MMPPDPGVLNVGRPVRTDAPKRRSPSPPMPKAKYRVEAHRSDDFSVAVHFTVTVDTSLPPPQQQGDQQQTPQEPVTTLPLPEPTGLGSISGGNQERVTGEVLANPFVIEVRDQYDKPIAGVTATFALLTGGGSLSATTATTDENGRAERYTNAWQRPRHKHRRGQRRRHLPDGSV